MIKHDRLTKERTEISLEEFLKLDFTKRDIECLICGATLQNGESFYYINSVTEEGNKEREDLKALVSWCNV